MAFACCDVLVVFKPARFWPEHTATFFAAGDYGRRRQPFASSGVEDRLVNRASAAVAGVGIVQSASASAC